MKRDERGSALIEMTWLSLLLLVPLVYVLVAVFVVQSGSYAVSGAARAAARAADRQRPRVRCAAFYRRLRASP